MIRTLAVWVVGSLGIACVLTPLAYSFFQQRMEPVPWPYSRVFNRVAMLTALALLVLLRRRLDTEPLRAAWRRETWAQRARRIPLGLVLALGPALLVLPLVVAGGEVRWSPDCAGALVRIGRAIPGAVAASFLEEAFFRGIVFLGLARRVGTPSALVGSSLLYSWIHFLAPRKDFIYPGWSPGIGFEYFALVLERFGDMTLLMGFLGLVWVGVALCGTLLRSGSLALCIGLHAGWFVAAKAGVHLVQLVPGREFAPSIGKRLFLLGQPWTWLAIAASLLAVEVMARRMRARAVGPGSSG